MAFSKRLERLIKKKLAIVSEDKFFENKDLNQKFTNFLEGIDDIFNQLEKKLNLCQSTLDLSTKELNVKNMDLESTNYQINNILENLDEGLLYFGADGICSKSYSQKCIDLLEGVPAGRHILDVLNISGEQRAQYEVLLSHLFEGFIPYAELIELGPDSYLHSSKERFIKLDYRPVFAQDDVEMKNLQGIILLASDITKEINSDLQAKAAILHSQMVAMTVVDWNSFVSFFNSYKEYIEQLRSKKVFLYEDILRVLHNIKGTANSLMLRDIGNLCHDLESDLVAFTNVDSADEKYKGMQHDLTTKLADALSVLLRDNNQIFSRYTGDSSEFGHEIRDFEIKAFEKLLSSENVSPEIKKEFELKFVKPNEAVSVLFKHLVPKMTNLANSLEKKVRFEIVNEENNLIDKSFYNDFFNQIFHLLNNCIYHGIEDLVDRQTLGKNPVGVIRINIKKVLNNSNEMLEIVIADDGNGINLPALKSSLQIKGIDVTDFTDEKIMQQIFLAGVSTEQELNNNAGRGIGMDSVAYTIEKIKGSIKVSSIYGAGTKFIILLPYKGV